MAIGLANPWKRSRVKASKTLDHHRNTLESKLGKSIVAGKVTTSLTQIITIIIITYLKIFTSGSKSYQGLKTEKKYKKKTKIPDNRRSSASSSSTNVSLIRIALNRCNTTEMHCQRKDMSRASPARDAG